MLVIPTNQKTGTSDRRPAPIKKSHGGTAFSVRGCHATQEEHPGRGIARMLKPRREQLRCCSRVRITDLLVN
ncbi:hypothetical protein T265_02306 [Opisthorchis viverrini]|uniref:Uncharacterized protein n=1 Tax=Opisthorchis viverrini TaxID=6198 RepID=A0A074ZZE5_OPIVI|nr:hypothetical protein T265_02306 [Opisthorchis viverrini]KER31387.1 hypothetical protein T265_02306 [Opisthorchis viverrini]